MSENGDRNSIKQRLKEFYGNDNNTNLFIDPDDPMHMDSFKFDARIYVEKCLKTKDLSDLMAEEKALSEQIRSLDCDMQNLVYENYSKFINATDTIKMMKSNFSFVQTEMNSLVEKMAFIAELSNELNDQISDNRKKMKTLSITKSTLNKLDFLVELPDRLRLYMKTADWDSMFEDLNKAKYIFKCYRNTPAFKSIQEDCSSIISLICTKLWDQLNQSSSNSECAIVINALFKLGIFRDQLSSNFIRVMKSYLGSKLDQMCQSTSKECNLGENMSSGGEQDILQFSNQITDTFLMELTNFAGTYINIFLTKPNDYETNTILEIICHQAAPSSINRDLSRLEDQICSSIEDLTNKFLVIVRNRFELEDTNVELNVLVRSMDRIHSRVQTFGRTLLITINTLNSSVNSDQNSVGLKLKELIVQFSNLTVNFLCQITRSQITYYLNVLCQDTMEAVLVLRQKLASMDFHGSNSTNAANNSEMNNKSQQNIRQLNSLFENLNLLLKSQPDNVLKNVKIFLSKDTTFGSKSEFRNVVCLDQIKDGLLIGYLNYLLTLFSDLTKNALCKLTGPLLLLLSKVCLTWASSDTISNFISLAFEMLTGTDVKIEESLSNPFSCSSSLQSPSSNSINPSNESVSDLTNRFRQVGDQLLIAYVRLEGNNLAQLLRKSVETRDWLKILEPRSVRSVVKRFIADLTVFDAQISQLFPSQSRGRDKPIDSRFGRGHRSNMHSNITACKTNKTIKSTASISSDTINSTTSSGSNHTGTGNNMRNGGDRNHHVIQKLDDIEFDPTLATHLRRLFTQRVDIFATVEPNRESLLMGLIKIGLKTLVECVRLQKFGRFGLQQIQVDCRYLQTHLWQYVHDDKLINSLLDDVVYSVVQRCIDPQLMDDNVVDAICDRIQTN